MFRALALSIGQLGDPAFLKVLAKSLALTILLFFLFGFALYWGLVWLFDRLGWAEGGGLAAAAAAAIVAGLSMWLVFRAVAMAVISLFGEEILAAVERKHYPARARAAIGAPISDQAEVALVSAGRAIVWNVIAIPLYFIPVVNIVGFFAVNALLLSRDLADMVALRHVPKARRRDWLRSTRAERIGLGLVGAGLFVIPVANLLAPILSAAMAAHMLHEGDPREPQSPDAIG